MLKNCAHVKLVSCKATKKATMKTKKQLLFPPAMGDEAIATTPSCIIRDILMYTNTELKRQLGSGLLVAAV